MAYTTVPTVASGDLWTAANHNTYIRDNFAAGVPAIFSAKGDLAVASGLQTAGRLAVGVEGTALLADPSQPLGLRWGDLSTVIHSVRLTEDTASPYTISNIPQTFKTLLLYFSAHVITAGDDNVPAIRFNGDAGNNYGHFYTDLRAATDFKSNNSASSGLYLLFAAGGSHPAQAASACSVLIPNYSGSGFYKTVLADAFLVSTDTTEKFKRKLGGGNWRNTAAITSISIVDCGTIKAGSVITLVGIK
jgi:hypothetical protein